MHQRHNNQKEGVLSMKRLFALLLIVALLVPVLPVQAETWYVYTKNGKTLNLRDENTGKVIGHIPYGTALEPDSGKSTEVSAYVTYNGISGYVKWSFLQREKPKSRGASKPEATPTPAPTPEPTPAPDVPGVPYGGTGSVPYQEQDETEGFEISVINAYIQYANSANKGTGSKWETLRVKPEDNIVITADVPRGKKIDYWVINGVRYDFNKLVKTIRLTNADADFQFEVVFKNDVPRTQISPQAIQDARGDSQLLLTTKNAQFCHINPKDKGAGGWIKEFDFTEDYLNRATGLQENGGQITAKIRAMVPKNQKIRGWKFNETELYPGGIFTLFIVRTLNTTMTYEPILRKVKTTATAKPPKTPSKPKDPEPEEPNPPVAAPTYYNISCKGCTFSGGGYSGATSGKVLAGTTVTFRTDYSGGVSYWTINGSKLMKIVKRLGHGHYIREPSTVNSFSRKVNRDLNVVCVMKIN